MKMDGCLIPADRKRQFIRASWEPWAGLASGHSVAKILGSFEVVVCLDVVSLP